MPCITHNFQQISELHLRLAVVRKTFELVYVQYAPHVKRSKEFSFKQAVQEERENTRGVSGGSQAKLQLISQYRGKGQRPGRKPDGVWDCIQNTRKECMEDLK